jgi:hypothetical protein
MASGQQGGHVPLSPVGDVTSVVELGAQLQAEASRHGIHNVFDDNGYKELLILRLFDLRKLDRAGDDAEDDVGRRYEIKTVARIDARGNRKKNLSITTEHTLTVENLTRYRNVYLWIIAVFDQAQPEAIYEIPPASLERYFADWQTKLIRQESLRAEGGAPVHLNNPKIPLGFIEKHGTRVWPEGSAQLRLDVEAGLAEAADTLPGT